MLINGDIIRITDAQTFIGQDVLNVYYYEIANLVDGVIILDLLLVFEDTVMNPVADLQVPSLQHLFLKGENASNNIDIQSLATNVFGDSITSGPPLPSYVSCGFSLNTSDRLTRNGSKRFSGIGETHVANNLYTPTPGVAELVEERLMQVLTVEGLLFGSMLATPVIVGRIPITGALDLSKISQITEVVVVSDIRTQVSRRS